MNETLRALIAEPSIVGLGFGSREEAVSTEDSALDKGSGAGDRQMKLES